MPRAGPQRVPCASLLPGTPRTCPSSLPRVALECPPSQARALLFVFSVRLPVRGTGAALGGPLLSGLCSACGSGSLLQAPMASAHCATGLPTASGTTPAPVRVGGTECNGTTASGLWSARAASAGLSPEVEKLGLLPPRPAELGACETGSCQPSGRRPADVYLPACGIRGPAAFDLAVTSGLKSGSVASSALHAGKVAAAYRGPQAQLSGHRNSLPWPGLAVRSPRCRSHWGGLGPDCGQNLA